MSKRRKHDIKVVFEELGENPPNGKNGTSFGETDKKTEISLDPRQSEGELLDSAVHELLHVCFPNASEESVHAKATRIADTLWKMGYRRVIQ
jgi:hypothetical protein